MAKKNDPLKPSATTLIKIGSAMVHAQELFEKNEKEVLAFCQHAEFDLSAFKTVAYDPEVTAWIKDMGPMLPRKR